MILGGESKVGEGIRGRMQEEQLALDTLQLLICFNEGYDDVLVSMLC